MRQHQQSWHLHVKAVLSFADISSCHWGQSTVQQLALGVQRDQAPIDAVWHQLMPTYRHTKGQAPIDAVLHQLMPTV